MFEELLRNTTVEEAAKRLLAMSWNHVGTSNWCEVFADPNDHVAIRLSTFDPTQTMFAQLCLDLPDNRWLPHVETIVAQAGGGDAIIMERLWPSMEHEAAELIGAIDMPEFTPSTVSPHNREISRFEPNVLALRSRLRKLFAEGKARYRSWGGADLREGKVLTDTGGAMKLCDPAYLSGPMINQAILDGDRELLSDFTREELLLFLRLPYFCKDLARQHERERLEARLNELDLRESNAA